jgi:hypothetical protein
MPTPTIQEVAKITQKIYDQIWNDWYSEIPLATKARVETVLSNDAAGYIHSENRIYNPICDGDLDYPGALHQEWPIWQVQLVHEMLHEWQFKKPCIPTAAAESLFQMAHKRFAGQGHGPDFYQAIVEKAEYFQMSPDALISRI